MFILEQTEKLKNSPIWLKAGEKIKEKDLPVYLCGKNYGFLSFLVSSFFAESSDNFFLLICQDSETAETFYANIKTFLPKKVLLFPERDLHLPPDHPIQAKEIERVKVLAEIWERDSGLVVSSINAISLFLPDLSVFKSHILDLSPGTRIKRETIIARLIRYGYEEVSIVENPGEFCRRGGIVDFYPFEEKPVRIEFSGDAIKSLRRFDPVSQMSIEKVSCCRILSLNETFITDLLNSTIFDYLGKNLSIFITGYACFESRYNQMNEIVHRSNRKTMVCWEDLKNKISKAAFLETELNP